MKNINELVVSYIAAWNERNPEKRRALVVRTWTEQGSYVDAHRQAVGHDAIDTMIAAAQESHPGYTLRLVSGIEAHGPYARFSWEGGGTREAPLYLGGTDFVSVAKDGRFGGVVGFTDAAPAAA